MLKLLQDDGYEFTDDEAEADVAIVNSCAFIGDAKEESISEILRLAGYKKEGRLKALVVAGCLAERYQKELLSELPEVDGAVGISAWDHLPEVLRTVLSGTNGACFLGKERIPSENGRILTTGGHFGYLKIAEGCNKHCSYCVIPKIRGHYRSIPMEDLLKETEEMVSSGVRELILVAQETTVYGMDLYGKKMLPELLRRLARIEDLHWIRLLYCYPEEITDELIRTIREEKKIVRYLDLPIQHISDRILKSMHRMTTGDGIRKMIRKLRKEIPGIALRTTLIAGYPGETEEESEELLRFVKEVRFDRLGAFAYSKEEDTEAYHLHPQIPRHIKNRRKNRIMKAERDICRALTSSLVGKTMEVFVEGRMTGEEGVYVGRTYRDAPDVDGLVFFSSDADLLSGQFVRVRMTGAKDYDLIGELAQ